MTNKKAVLSFDEQAPAFTSKELVRYYVDGGIKLKNNKGAYAFIKKQYAKKTKVSARASEKGSSSTDSEILAVKLAMKDALDKNLDPRQVIILTDQKSLAFPTNLKRSNSKMAVLRKEIDEYGFQVKYMKSQHTLTVKELETAPARVKNALAVHTVVQAKLNKPSNRYLYHLKKKRAKKKTKQK